VFFLFRGPKDMTHVELSHSPRLAGAPDTRARPAHRLPAHRSCLGLADRQSKAD